MARRKRVFTEFFEELDKAVEYIKRVKDINKDQVMCELYETILGMNLHGWFVEVWKI